MLRRGPLPTRAVYMRPRHDFQLGNDDVKPRSYRQLYAFPEPDLAVFDDAFEGGNSHADVLTRIQSSGEGWRPADAAVFTSRYPHYNAKRASGVSK